MNKVSGFLMDIGAFLTDTPTRFFLSIVGLIASIMLVSATIVSVIV
jgi:hypothetical protein